MRGIRTPSCIQRAYSPFSVNCSWKVTSPGRGMPMPSTGFRAGTEAAAAGAESVAAPAGAAVAVCGAGATSCALTEPGANASNPARNSDFTIFISVSILPRILHCANIRSEEHTSELQSLMRISYAVFCLKKKNKHKKNNTDVKHVSIEHTQISH